MLERLQDSDEELIDRARAGDQRAFPTLLSRHEAAARRLAEATLGACDLATQVVAEASTRLHAELLNGELALAFRVSLLQVVRRVATSHEKNNVKDTSAWFIRSVPGGSAFRDLDRPQQAALWHFRRRIRILSPGGCCARSSAP